MKYKVKMKLTGYSYIDDISYTFDDRIEALAFAETARFRADGDVLSSVSVDIIREEADA